MVNFTVRDLDAMLAQLRTAGVAVDDKIEEHEFGRFGWASTRKETASSSGSRHRRYDDGLTLGGRVTADDLPASVTSRPDVRDAKVAARVTISDPRGLVVARDHDRRVSIDLGVDLVVRELVDRVGASGGLEQLVATQRACGAVQRELLGEQSLEPLSVASLHGTYELVRQRDELLSDDSGRRGHSASTSAGCSSKR